MQYSITVHINCTVEIQVSKTSVLVPVRGMKDSLGNNIAAYREKGESRSQPVVIKDGNVFTKQDVLDFIRSNCPVGNRLGLGVFFAQPNSWKSYVEVVCSWHTQEIAKPYLQWLPELEKFLK